MNIENLTIASFIATIISIPVGIISAKLNRISILISFILIWLLIAGIILYYPNAT